MRRGAGLYFNESNEAFVRVTNVLDIIHKPFLLQWYARETYYAMVKDPNISEEDAVNAARNKSRIAMDKGSLVHSMIEAFREKKDNEEAFPDHLQGYIDGFEKFLMENSMEIEKQEQTVFSRKHRFAGTLDLLTTAHGKRFLIDIKTGREIYDEATLQLSAYQYALEEQGIQIDERRIVLLNEKGTIKVVDPQYEIETFLAALRVWRWKNEKLVQEFQL